MDEVTELRQQVSALQLQNTQLMVRLVCLSLLLVCGVLGWTAFQSYATAPLFNAVPEFARYEFLTEPQQGLLRDQTPCPQSPAQESSSQESPEQGSYTVGVMVLGASGTFSKLPVRPKIITLFGATSRAVFFCSWPNQFPYLNLCTKGRTAFLRFLLFLLPITSPNTDVDLHWTCMYSLHSMLTLAAATERFNSLICDASNFGR